MTKIVRVGNRTYEMIDHYGGYINAVDPHSGGLRTFVPEVARLACSDCATRHDRGMNARRSCAACVAEVTV